MADERVYIIYDFAIKSGLEDQLEYARDNPPAGFDVDYPSRTGKTQGEIWRGIVKPELDRARRIIAFVDRPNANVGFEVGYALGSPADTKVALALAKPDIPAWLSQPPFKGYSVNPLPGDEDLERQIQSDDWIDLSLEIKPGADVLLLCPTAWGKRYLETAKKVHDWRCVDQDGWSLEDLPTQLEGVGAVVWLVTPHREGETARDGKANAAMAVIAGFAEARGLPVKVLVHEETRIVVDVLSRSLSFGGVKDLPPKLTVVLEDLRKVLDAVPAEDAPPPAAAAFERPVVGQLPVREFGTIDERFIGREGLLADLEDALRGLDARWRAEETTGGMRVQLTWYNGFGGMGKSWFLRRAMMRATEQLPDVRTALIDWDSTVWREPLTHAPESPRDLFTPIAYRLAQLFDVTDLDPYWRAEHRIAVAAPRRAELRGQFQTQLDQLRQGEDATGALRTTLKAENLWAGGDQLKANLETLENDRDLYERGFRRWVEHAGGVHQDAEATLNPDALRLSGLRESLDAVTRIAPLLLIFDTCELLSEDMDRWLRHLVAPMCDGRTPILVLVGSRLAPDVATRTGSRAGWRAEIEEDRWRRSPFDEGVRFTVDEVERALAHVTDPPADIAVVAEALHRISLGVPLALRSVLDLHEAGDPVLSELGELDPGDDGDELLVGGRRAEKVVVEKVAARFLLHLAGRADRRKDYADIVALSLLRKAGRPVLERFWPDTRVGIRLRELSQRYSLLAVGDLHSTVRSFLRRRWRLDDRDPLVDETIEQLAAVVEAIPLPGEPGESLHIEAVADRLNMRAWAEESAALPAFAPAIAVALAFEQQWAMLMELAAEVRSDPAREATIATLGELHDREDSWWNPIWHDAALLQWLRAERRLADWSPLESACLDVLLGLSEVRDERHEPGLRHLRRALEFFADRDVPRRQLVGSALFSIGYALGEAAATAQNAADAYDLAIRVGHSEPAVWNNRGVSLRRLGRHEEAESHLRKAIEMDESEPLYPRNLGDLFLDLKQYDEAERWYLKALDINPDYAYAHNGLGLLYRDQDRFDEAVAAYEKAIETSADEPLYPRALGDLYLRNGRYDEARTWYEKALAIDPRNGAAHNGLGLLHTAIGEFDAARACFERAMEVEKSDPLYPRNLADMLRGKQEYDEARRWYERSLANDPDYVHAHNGLGLLFRAMGRPDDAIVAFTRAAASEPEEPLYPRNVGDVHYAAKRYEEAQRWFERALAIDPDYATAHNDLAILFEAQDRTDEAVAAYHRAMEADPANPLYPRNLADLYRTDEQYDQAEEWYRRALEVDPDYARNYNGLGLLAEARNDVDAAIAAYEKAIELDAASSIYPQNLANLLRDRKQYDEAERWYRRALENDADAVVARNGLGLICRARGDVDAAAAEFAAAAELRPEDPLYCFNTGDLLHDADRLDEAEAWLLRSLAIRPDYEYALNSLGLVYEDLGRHDEAARAFEAAVAANEDEPIYQRNLGNLHRQAGRLDEAEAWYARTLQIDPDNAAAHDGLGLVREEQGRRDEALACFERAVELDPENPVFLRNLGNGLARLGRRDDAAAALDRALATGVDVASTENFYAWVWLTDLDDPEGAEPHALRALELEPQPEILHTLTEIQLRLGGWERAAASLERWLAASDATFVATFADDITATFRQIIDIGHGAELVRLLSDGDPPHWRAWLAALQLRDDPTADAGDEARALLARLEDDQLGAQG